MKRKYKVITNNDFIIMIVDGITDEQAKRKMNCLRKNDIKEMINHGYVEDEEEYENSDYDNWEIQYKEGL